MSAKAGASGGKTDVDVGTIYWDDIRRLMDLDEEYNRTNRYGAFGGWEYDPETKSQRFVATDPGMQAAQERMSRRLAGEGFENYQPPSQISSITDALMADRMGKMGLLTEQPELAGEYGERFADRQGGGYQSATPSPAPPPQGGYQPPAPAEPPPPEVQQPPPEVQQPPPTAGGGLPDDYYTKRGRARKKYRKQLFDPDASGLPPDLRNRKGTIRRKYRGMYDPTVMPPQQTAMNPMQPPPPPQQAMPPQGMPPQGMPPQAGNNVMQQMYGGLM
jgi:hypothetical protein